MASAEWLADLARTEKGHIRPTLSNAVTILQQDPVWGPEVLWYDVFLDRVFFTYHGPPRPWRDEDAYTLTIYMQTARGIENMLDSIVLKAAMLVAKQRERHCVRDYIAGLQWDGTPRIATAFERLWGCIPTPYVSAASANFFLGLAARILHPGCKLDTMPVFEGAQGIRKSSALQALGGAWYGVTHERCGTKDFLQGLRGLWLLEISELQSFGRAEINAVKNMMSAPHDDYRPSYGRAVIRYPRSCVFAGTTNTDDWGADDTGLRRFWPIRCGTIALDLIHVERDQLFAEAASAVMAEASWWDMPGLSTLIEQADRQHSDAWTDTVLGWCALQPTEDGLAIADVFVGALKMAVDRIDKRAEMRMATILRLADWTRVTRRVQGKPQKRWMPPATDEFSV